MLALCRGCSKILGGPNVKRLFSTRVEKIRNIGIIAHVDAGKTTITEQILLHTGQIKAAGRVDRGSTMTDFLECEQDHGITVNSASVQCHWKGYTLNIIDTPGHIDFNVEVERCMRVLDGSVLVLDGTRGVEAQTTKVFSQIKRFKVPAVIILNKFDRPMADFKLCLDSIKEQLRVAPLVLHYPIYNQQGVLTHIGNVVRREDYSISNHQLTSPTDLSLHTQYRTNLTETLADLDESLGDEYLMCDGDCEMIEDRLVEEAVRRVMMSGDGVPICLGSGLKGFGISSCLDMIVSYLPSPLHTQNLIPSELGKLCGVVYKASLDRTKGVLCQARIYSGTLRQSDRLYNTQAQCKEIVARIYRQDADCLSEIEECGPGDLVVLAGCKNLRTGDMFVDKSFYKQHSALQYHIKNNLLLNTPIQVTDPVFYCRLQCVSEVEQEKAEKALATMAFEDPTLIVKSGLNGEIVLCGSGELHLMIAHERLVQEHGVQCDLLAFQVSYKEMIVTGTEEIVVIATDETPLQLKVEITPAQSNQSKVSCFTVAQEEHVVMATKNSLLGGPLIGLPLINTSIHVRNICEDDRYHVAMETKDLVKQVQSAIRSLLQRAHISLAEPSANITVHGPQGYCNAIMSDFNQRHGDVEDVAVKADTFTLRGSAPLSHLIGYSSRVRSLSSGRVSLQIDPVNGYNAMDSCRSEDIISKIKSGQMYL